MVRNSARRVSRTGSKTLHFGHMPDKRRVPRTPPLRVGVLNLPDGVTLATTRSGQTPPAPKFVLGFPGFHHHHENSFGLGTFSSALALVDFRNWSRRRNLRPRAAL